MTPAAAPLYLQYGCGWCAPEGWLNFDASPTLRFERLPLIGRLHTRNAERFPANVRYGDVVKGLPPADGSCAPAVASGWWCPIWPPRCGATSTTARRARLRR